MTIVGKDILQTRKTLVVDDKTYTYYSLDVAHKAGIGNVERLPFSLKILLENMLRCADGVRVTKKDVEELLKATTNKDHNQEIGFCPARVLMQDFTGVPAIVDLAAMRDAMKTLGKDAEKINPLVPVDLVIDHSVMVDYYGANDAFSKNVEMEYQRNFERYAFLRWGQDAFRNFRVVPPGTGICHQVNLEYLAQVVWTSEDKDGQMIAYPDTLVGTDSHTTMVNGLSVLGWGVGGIEAEAAMLGQPLSMLIPEVVGFKLTGSLPEGSTATDLVLTITNILRTKGVVGKFVEFFGSGLDNLLLADRSTVANMAPEYGATCGFFPIDKETIAYLKFTGRDAHRVALVEAYAKAQGLWRDTQTPDPIYNEMMELDLSTIRPTVAGPKRPQDKIFLTDVKKNLEDSLKKEGKDPNISYAVKGKSFTVQEGHVAIAAITSCTNTSNPSVMLAAGLLARKANALGLKSKPWVKTSLAPGSQIVTDYLAFSGLDNDLNSLGFNLVGYGCTTCIGNSGPLAVEIASLIEDHDLNMAAVLSGNRNFEGRINPSIKSSYLASPPLVVAYALAGTVLIDFDKEPIAKSRDGKPVFLRDIWPSQKEINDAMRENLNPEMFRRRYADVFKGDENWQNISSKASQTYSWVNSSTYVQNPPYFDNIKEDNRPITNVESARILALLGDSVTTDHISPAGSIKKDGPAGAYLLERDIPVVDFNSYGSRRGNHEVMMRGTFANIRLTNEMVPGISGGITKLLPSGDKMSIYDAAMLYQRQETPLVVIAGKEYGTGSSRDWAAKGTRLLGVKAVIAESFERIHRSNLVGMGVLPLEFPKGMDRKTLNLSGEENICLSGLENGISPGMKVQCNIKRQDGSSENIDLNCRIDTQDEVDYFKNGGILPYVLKQLADS